MDNEGLTTSGLQRKCESCGTSGGNSWPALQEGPEVVEERLKIRANRTTGELEIEGPPVLVETWWTKIWPGLGVDSPAAAVTDVPRTQPVPRQNSSEVPDTFGEFFSAFRSDIRDNDRVLIAGAFVQARDPDRTFTTKSVNQLLLDQHIKVANASVSTRRLVTSKRAFVVTDGRFRLSATGFEHLKLLKMSDA